MANLQPGVRHRGGAQLLQRDPNALHGLDHVGTRLADRIHRQGGLTVHADPCRRLGVAEPHECNIVHRDTSDPGDSVAFRAQDHVAHGLEGVQFAFRAHHVAALAFLDVAGRNARVGGAQGGNHIGHRELKTSHQLRLDDHLDLPLAATEDIHACDAWNAFQAVDDNIVDEVAVGVDRPVVAVQPDDVEPGNRIIVAARGIEGRFVNLVRIVGDAVEPVSDQQQSPIHVGGDRELQGHACPAGFRARGDGFQAF